MNLNYFCIWKELSRLLALAAALAGPPLVQAGEAPLVLDGAYLERLRAEVRASHPTIAAAQARLEAAQAGVRAVRLWEDPMVGFGVMKAQEEMRRDDGDLMFGAEQTLPRPKLYRAMKARAHAERAVMESEKKSAILKLETEATLAAVELALMDEMLAIDTNQLTWLESMAANARERLKDPMMNASEPLRMESELAQEKQKYDARTRDRQHLARELNILLGRSAEAQWPGLRLPESAGLTPSLADEMSRLFQANPMVQALLNTAVAAKLEMEVARRERAPMVSLGVDTSVYSGGDFRQATFGAKVTIPIFNKSVYDAAVERARFEQIAAEREVEAMERELRRQAVAAHAAAENAAHQAASFSRDVLPRIEKAAESTQIAWITTKASILEVLEARRSLLNARLEERRFVAAHHGALETLRSIVPPQP